MVLVLSQSSVETERQQNEENATKASVSRTRQAAEALSSRKDSECIEIQCFKKQVIKKGLPLWSSHHFALFVEDFLDF